MYSNDIFSTFGAFLPSHCLLFAYVHAGLNVSIIVDYSHPAGFFLPSPPYYRPASSVTLRCIAHGAIGTVDYQWTSTQNKSFAHGARGESIFQRILTAFDAGTHSCMATDELGNTGIGLTDMKLYGTY